MKNEIDQIEIRYDATMGIITGFCADPKQFGKLQPRIGFDRDEFVAKLHVPHNVWHKWDLHNLTYKDVCDASQ